MIRRLDIPNFGSFYQFNWKASLKEEQIVSEFRRLNIFFGRNYSGKTTLSRVFRSFEVRELPDNYQNPDFEITTYDQTTLTQENISSHSLDIRVYNTDFVNENLSFLTDSAEGEVKPFAIIGSENKDTEEQIRGIEKELGNVEEKTGKKYELTQKEEKYQKENQKAKKAEKALEDKLRRYANDKIKHNQTYGHANYNITTIKKDIRTVREKSIPILEGSQVSQKENLLREKSLPSIEIRVFFHPKFKTFYQDSAEILAKEIKPSEPIQELLNDSLLQTWVRTGMNYHRDKRSTCGFCGQPLPKDLWEKLDAHFNKESFDLENRIISQIASIESEINSLSEIELPERESFYTSVRSLFEEIKGKFHKTFSFYKNQNNKLLRELHARQENIFKPRRCPNFKDFSREISDCINELNKIIELNDKKTASLSDDQKKAREELRLNAVAEFINNINLSGEEKEVTNLKNQAEKTKGALDSLELEVKQLEKDKERLQMKLQDERKGADKVNEYLNDFFGLEGLKLVAKEDDEVRSKYKFQIMRGDQPAYNMSEGERNLVSFCYFMAKLEDIESKGKELIVYIDDPVSSLDSNHIFFVFSLIESVLANPEKNSNGSNSYRYKQLFISTHNLDFLKYLKRLSRPKENHGGTEFFLIEKEELSSNLRLMPRYLKDYQTEFIYLFHQIYKCKDAKPSEENHEVSYNFGNNLRKFLEAYLFYKYPHIDDNSDKLERLCKFFGNDITTTVLTNRVSNELSHLEGIFDRSMKPIEVPELSKVANFVLDTIREKDKEQYDSLLKSIGESP